MTLTLHTQTHALITRYASFFGIPFQEALERLDSARALEQEWCTTYVLPGLTLYHTPFRPCADTRTIGTPFGSVLFAGYRNTYSSCVPDTWSFTRHVNKRYESPLWDSAFMDFVERMSKIKGYDFDRKDYDYRN